MTVRLIGELEQLDLYRLHWPDPPVLIGATVEVFTAMQNEGLVRYVELSNVSVVQLQEASSVVQIVSAQNHFSPFDQSDRAMLEHCAENSTAYLCYSPLGGVAGAKKLAASFPGAARAAIR